MCKAILIWFLGMMITNTLHAEEIADIVVASMNQVKLSAVEEVVADYAGFSSVKVRGVAVETSVRDQPLSLEEVVRGAKERAVRAFADCKLSIGLESGLMEIPVTDGEYMDICICSIYDGQRHHIGMSCGFRLPKEVTNLIVNEGLDLNQAMHRCGLTCNPTLGGAEGAIGLLTNGRICRKDYCKQAIITALISIENSSLL